MNEIKIDGVIARDPELRPAGSHTVGKFSIAHRNEKGSDTSFFDIEVWNDLATQCQNYRKGDKISVDGYIKQDQWQAADGAKRSRVKIVGKRVSQPVYGNQSVQSGPIQSTQMQSPTGEVSFDDKLPF